MSQTNVPRVVFGFLTVRPTANDGVRGGYLLTTEHGRPIEFHYTSELRLRGPQRVLFGVRVDEFLEVDLVALPLTERQSVVPSVVVVDRPALLELRTRIPAPVVCLSSSNELNESWTADVHSTQLGDRKEFENAVDFAPPNFDWLEPFERLSAALSEIRDSNLAA